MLDGGGYAPRAQVAFAVLALLALAAALATGDAAARRRARTPVAGVLALLAALGALSSLWTVGSPDDALRWGLLAAGYAALVAAAAVVAGRDRDRVVLLAAVGLLAAFSGAVGLLGAATFSEPHAYRPTGAWRPAGTLEYVPALALLQAGVLPALLRALCAGGRAAPAVAFAAAIAGAVLGTANSRIGTALALAICAGAVLAPRATVGARRTRAIAAVAVPVAAALAARALVGGPVARGAEPGGWRVVAVLAVCAGAAALWAVLPRLVRRPRAAGAVLAVLVAGVAAAGTVSGFAGSAALQDPAGAPRAAPAAHRAGRDPGELLHGRGAIWRAGLEAFGERPLQGHGADAFFPATARLQSGPVTAYAHDLPLEVAVELGVGGLLLVLALYVACGRALWRARRSAAAWCAGVPSAAFLAASLLDWPWHLAGMGAVWAVATGLLAGGSSTVAAASLHLRKV